jgi:hypothetical protein
VIPAQLMLNFFVLLGAVPKTTRFFLPLRQLQCLGAHKNHSPSWAAGGWHPHVKKGHLFPIQAIGRIASNDPWLGFVCNRAQQRGLTSNHNLKAERR